MTTDPQTNSDTNSGTNPDEPTIVTLQRALCKLRDMEMEVQRLVLLGIIQTAWRDIPRTGRAAVRRDSTAEGEANPCESAAREPAALPGEAPR